MLLRDAPSVPRACSATPGQSVRRLQRATSPAGRSDTSGEPASASRSDTSGGNPRRAGRPTPREERLGDQVVEGEPAGVEARPRVREEPASPAVRRSREASRSDSSVEKPASRTVGLRGPGWTAAACATHLPRVHPGLSPRPSAIPGDPRHRPGAPSAVPRVPRPCPGPPRPCPGPPRPPLALGRLLGHRPVSTPAPSSPRAPGPTAPKRPEAHQPRAPPRAPPSPPGPPRATPPPAPGPSRPPAPGPIPPPAPGPPAMTRWV
jgi:hypothetical protein